MAVPTTADLDALAAMDVQVAIEPEVLKPVLSAPPFISIPSLINARDIGAVPGSAVPPGRIYRCGVLDIAAKDPEAVAWLAGHVTRIFDIRKAVERETAPDPSIPGVENVWFPTEGQYLEPEVVDFVEGAGSVAWKRQLLSVTDAYKPIFREVLKHIRDRPTEAFLFHCTGTYIFTDNLLNNKSNIMLAGRDRTGVMASMLQHLAGTPADAIVRDYMLSRIGTEPARDKLLAFIMTSLGVTDTASPGFVDMVSLRPQYLSAFLQGLEEQYGGWDSYVTKTLGFSDEDLAKIKKNLQS
jgi:hypothetical protein